MVGGEESEAKKRGGKWVLPSLLAVAFVLMLFAIRSCTHSSSSRVGRLLSVMSEPLREPGKRTGWLIKLGLIPEIPQEQDVELILGELTALGGSAVPSLIDALEDERLEARIVAVMALGRIDDRRGVRPLMSMLQRRHVGRQLADSPILFPLKGPGGRPQKIIEIDQTEVVHLAVVRTLGKIGDARAAAALVELLPVNPALTIGDDGGGSDMSSSPSAHWAIVGGRTVVMYRKLGAETVRALEALGPASADVLSRKLADTHGGVRLTSALVLWGAGDGRGGEVLAAALEKNKVLAHDMTDTMRGWGWGLGVLDRRASDGASANRLTAAKLLPISGDAGAVAILIRLLGDEDPTVASEGRSSLVMMGRVAAEPLRKFIANGSGPALARAKSALDVIEHPR